MRSGASYRNPENPLAILVPGDNDTLAKALMALAELNVADLARRRHGCNTLIELFRAQGDNAGADKVSKRCM